MARKPREEFEGALNHVWARGNRRRSIFLDDRDRRRYLALLEEVICEFDWICLAYCLMDNHVHAIIETPRANLAAGMQALHGRYAQEFNERHDLDGHLFQGRYGSKLIRSDAQLVVTAAYVALNPVEAGLCRRPEDWRWSSFGATALGAAPAWLDADSLLARLGSLTGGDGLAAFAALVEN